MFTLLLLSSSSSRVLSQCRNDSQQKHIYLFFFLILPLVYFTYVSYFFSDIFLRFFFYNGATKIYDKQVLGEVRWISLAMVTFEKGRWKWKEGGVMMGYGNWVKKNLLLSSGIPVHTQKTLLSWRTVLILPPPPPQIWMVFAVLRTGNQG